MTAWLVACLFRDIAHPILRIGGEQGAAKTTGTRFLGRMLDPSNQVKLRFAPSAFWRRTPASSTPASARASRLPRLSFPPAFAMFRTAAPMMG